jgi:hypothetical protein
LADHTGDAIFARTMSQIPTPTIIGLDARRRTIAIWGIVAMLVAAAGFKIVGQTEAAPVLIGVAAVVALSLALGLRRTGVVPSASEITQLECYGNTISIWYGVLVPPTSFTWADVRFCELRTKKPSWHDGYGKSTGLTITFNNRTEKVLYAKATFIPERPWFLEAFELLLSQPNVSWRLNGVPCTDMASLQAAANALHAAHRPGPSDIGLRAKATEFTQ